MRTSIPILVSFLVIILVTQCNSQDITELISKDTFNQMLMHRNDGGCPAKDFYSYEAFIAAARSFQNFATTGSVTTRKREIAAFFGQTSHETTGGLADGPYTWGYCYKREINPSSNYCQSDAQWPCAPGKSYYGRGPMQISYNYNYGQAGRALGLDLLNNPDLVENDATISFRAAMWFWMTPQSPKPSPHQVVHGLWKPSGADQSASRFPGYGVITNIINGGVECGKGPTESGKDRIRFYKRYCEMMGIGLDQNLGCANQRPFGS